MNTDASRKMESLSRTAEKLIILLDYSNGLLTRVHGCVNYRKGPVFSELCENYVKLIDHLGQKKDDPSIGINKQQGNEVINMKSEALENETRFCYETIADILLFTNEVEPLFHTLCASIMVFDIHKNSDLTTRFLGVFFNYVRIYWLISRITDGRIACYLYILAYKEHFRQEPDEAHLVKKFIFDNYNYLKQIQERLMQINGICEAIQSAIECVKPSFLTWTSYDALQQGQYFSLSQGDPSLFSHPIDEKNLELYMDASHLDSIGTWIVYLYLVFPEKLEEEQAREQLNAALNDRTVVILYRDELVDAMLEYSQLTKTSIETLKIPAKHISKLLKSVKMDDVTFRHRQMRRLLRREIRGILDLTQALPGVIPVKLPMLMACLALSRYEIFWVFTHMSLTESRYKLKESSIAAPYLPDLMFHCMKLLELILNARDLIHLYYKEQLVIDLQQLIPFAQQMRKLAKVDVEVLDNVDHIITEINELNNNNNGNNNGKSIKSLEGLRLNWYRASASLSKEPSVLKKPEGHAMAALMNPLIEHTRYFDRLDKEVDARGSMASLWFYRSYMAQIFNNYCLGKEDSNVINPIRQGRYWIVFLQVFSQALLNVHRQRPEEMDQIGISALSKSEAYLNGATSRIEVSLRNVLGQHSKWNSQIEASTVADHLIANDGRRRGWKQLPGFESFYQNKEVLTNLKSNLDTIGDMCASFAEIPNIIIANQRLFPGAYLYQLMHDFFYQELRLLVQENQRTMVRPTRFISRLERLFKACYRIGNYINLDLERMIKQLLYYDFYDDSVGIVGGALGMPHKRENMVGSDGTNNNTTGGGNTNNGNNNSGIKKLLIHDIRDWYVGIVDSRCAAPGSGAVYSPILDGFYDYNSNQQSPIEDYCSLTELESLCQIIGPSGVRVIDIEIVKIGHSAMQKIASCLEKNKDLIYSVDLTKFYDIERWMSICKKFQGLDIISRQGVTIGSVIIFRKLLRKALNNVIKRRVPFIGDTVNEIHSKLYNESMYYEAFSHLGLDCGIMSNFTDNVMRNVFYQLAMENNKIWHYIPFVFGICFYNESFWDSGKYSMKLGALKNNGFALANCVDTLITIFSEKSLHRKNKLLFLDIMSRTLLYRKKLYPNKQSINELFLFIDYFIDVSNDLTQNDLQNHSVPYEILRAQLVKTYGDASGFYSNATYINNENDETKDNNDD